MIPTIDHLIGQQDVVRQLRVALEAAFQDSTRLPHALLTGPAGCGKTTVAQILGREMGVKVHEIIAQAVTGPQVLNGLFLEANDKEIVFVDEIHELHPKIQHSLLRLLEDGVLFVTNKDDKVLPLPISDVTVVGATTDEYMLIEPFRQRFPLVIPFTLYDNDSLTRIVLQRARMIGVELTYELAHEIAVRGRNTPRLAIRLLEACRRVARSKGENEIEARTFYEAVSLEGLDHLGLGDIERRYLRLLAERPDEAFRLSRMEAMLGTNRYTLQRITEPYLVRMGLLVIDSDGRRITAKALEHLGLLQPQGDVPF